MSVRAMVAGLLVGVLGIATLALALAGEHFIFKQVGAFLAQHPEAFPVPPLRAALWTGALTLWVGLLLGLLYELSQPAPGWRTGVRFALVCWLGFALPFLLLTYLWVHTSVYLLGTAAAGYLLQFAFGGLLLARIIKPAPAPSSVASAL